MTPIMLIRHGPTGWNAEGRIQGHSDVPLSAAGRDTVKGWRLPPELAAENGDWDWLSSPLARARETAALLRHGTGGPETRFDDALMEMRWGDWEGRRLDELRAEDGTHMATEEARGLDFRPPGGESPRDVQDRLMPLLAALAAAGRPTAAITHRGVIRAVYARATGWDMTGRPPEKLRDGCAHRFVLEVGGAPRTDHLNIPLAP